MGKKKVRKHQKEPNESSHSSEDEDNDIISSGKSCPHIVKSVSLSGVKKVLKHGLTLGQCESCSARPVDGRSSDAEANNENDIVWMCLQCGHQGCGRNSNGQHALHHFKTPRSDAHSVATNTVSWEVCYECDDEINGESNKKLSECINYIRRQGSVSKIGDTGSSTSRSLIEKVNGFPVLNGDRCKAENKDAINKPLQKKLSASSSNTTFRVKGLRNLGNTCFFNAIMQNLTRCHWLSFLLEDFCAKPVPLILPGLDIKTESQDEAGKNNIDLDPLTLILNECGTLTQSLIDFFRDMRSSTQAKGAVVNPGSVLGQICKKAPQFRGARQQDSHELLRHLIDGIRTEEIKRQKAAILKSFNLREKVDPKIVPEDTKQKIRAYGRVANHTVVDWLFSGHLISTVLCKECNAASQISEPFLDLSLPIAEEKPLRPVIHRRCSNENEATDCPISVKSDTSRYKEKKNKRKARKDAKRGRSRLPKSPLKEKQITNNSFENSSEPDETSQLECGDSGHSDGADIEDNTESESLSINDAVLLETNVLSPSNEISNELGSRLNGLDLNAIETNSDDEACEEMCQSQVVSQRNRVRQLWLAKSLTSLSPRYQPASHECSVLSCLNQFTAPELLTGNNKFGCENCTKIRNEKLAAKSEEKERKRAYNASKQLLILSPPAVMTLHLKRFQQVGHALRKVNRHVDFPLVLNLAPFCSSICMVNIFNVPKRNYRANKHFSYVTVHWNFEPKFQCTTKRRPNIALHWKFDTFYFQGLPNMEEAQSCVLYSLFGVVEHMGRLASGHYTAFVKSRNVDHAPDKFLNLKAANQFDLNKLIDEMVSQAEMRLHSESRAEGDGSGTSKNIEELTKSRSGKWYYISDSSVSEVPEATVLRSQAYILFYERIL
uniref:Ubiquitin carboxyl-terminal hydrolase n=1 Tax=Strigamia maritima TaxID=126957 RepID=T1JHZ2_STRMM